MGAALCVCVCVSVCVSVCVCVYFKRVVTGKPTQCEKGSEVTADCNTLWFPRGYKQEVLNYYVTVDL